jgi:hypothetical protein
MGSSDPVSFHAEAPRDDVWPDELFAHEPALFEELDDAKGDVLDEVGVHAMAPECTRLAS